MAVALNLKPVRPDVVMHFPAGESVCLHHLDNGTYFKLNNVSAYIWEQCDGTLTVDEIADRVALAFQVDKSATLDDVIEFFENMKQNQCIAFAGE